MEPILKVTDLRKDFRSHWTFRKTTALHGVSFEIQQGEVFGFLGHNGAGKTTTIKCILGLISTSGGSIEYRGAPLVHAAQRDTIGYLPELPYFYDHLTVRETLEYFASLYGMKSRLSRADFQRRVDETITRVGLDAKSASSVRSLSKGLQQRLGLAQAIIHRPAFLLLDEPFSGLDPIGRHEFRKIILDLKRDGTTIVLSSHILGDVQNICDRVFIMARGELKTVFAIKDLGKLFGESWELTFTPRAEDAALVAALAQRAAETIEHLPQVTLRYASYDQAIAAVAELARAGVPLREFKSASPDLEQIFLTVTKGEERERPAPHVPSHPEARP